MKNRINIKEDVRLKNVGRKKSTPKQRITYLTLDMWKPVSANAMRFNPKTGELTLLHNGKPLIPNKVTVDTGYKRKKGRKYLNKGSLPTDKLYANPNRVLELYDDIYAIDTNYRTINSVRIAVTGIVGGQNLKPGIPNHTAIRYRPLKCLEFRNPKGRPENLGWKITIELILRAPNFKKTTRVACIVDSDLGNRDNYNSQSIPLFDDFYLPNNFQLIYASSDSGKENLANQMLSMADNNARAVLKIIKDGKESGVLKATQNNEPYSHFRVWEPAT